MIDKTQLLRLLDEAHVSLDHRERAKIADRIIALDETQEQAHTRATNAARARRETDIEKAEEGLLRGEALIAQLEATQTRHPVGRIFLSPLSWFHLAATGVDAVLGLSEQLAYLQDEIRRQGRQG
jgi:hypothetical protein